MGYKISFLINARNESQSVLDATIDGLRETTRQHPREIIVIDDGSDVPATCTSPEVRVIRNEAAVGVSRARRHAASIAGGDVLVWLDAHMTFAPDWLDQMLNHVDSGALLCSAFWDYELSTCHCWGADFLWCGERNYWEGLSPGFGLRHRTKFPGPGAVDVPMIVGACYMTLRSSYEQFGGCSPLFRVYGADDIDISARAWITGLGVKCVTSAKVGHLSRSAFPYQVNFEHFEFNQLALVRTVFEEQTVDVLERYFEPIPEVVDQWLDQTDFSEFREEIQSRRRMSDEVFFRRVAPKTPVSSHRSPWNRCKVWFEQRLTNR
jgi:glycosyltransferase involved in cell wall biosynthesis